MQPPKSVSDKPLLCKEDQDLIAFLVFCNAQNPERLNDKVYTCNLAVPAFQLEQPYFHHRVDLTMREKDVWPKWPDTVTIDGMHLGYQPLKPLKIEKSKRLDLELSQYYTDMFTDYHNSPQSVRVPEGQRDAYANRYVRYHLRLDALNTANEFMMARARMHESYTTPTYLKEQMAALQMPTENIKKMLEDAQGSFATYDKYRKFMKAAEVGQIFKPMPPPRPMPPPQQPPSEEHFLSSEKDKKQLAFIAKYAAKGHVYEEDKPLTLKLTKSAWQQMIEKQKAPFQPPEYIPGYSVFREVNNRKGGKDSRPNAARDHESIEATAELSPDLSAWTRYTSDMAIPVEIPVEGKNIVSLLERRYQDLMNAEALHVMQRNKKTELDPHQLGVRYARYVMDMDTCHTVTQFFKDYTDKADKANKGSFDIMLATAKAEMKEIGISEDHREDMAFEITEYFNESQARRKQAKPAQAPMPKIIPPHPTPPPQTSKDSNTPPPTTTESAFENFLVRKEDQKILAFTAKYATKGHIYEDENAPISQPLLTQMREEREDPNKFLRLSTLLLPSAGDILQVMQNLAPRIQLPSPQTYLEKLQADQLRVEGEVNCFYHWPASKREVGIQIKAEQIPLKGRNIMHLLEERYTDIFNAQSKHLDTRTNVGGEKERDEKAARYALYYAEMDAGYAITHYFKTFIEKSPASKRAGFEPLLEQMITKAQKEMAELGMSDARITSFIGEVKEHYEAVKKSRDITIPQPNPPTGANPLQKPGPRAEEADVVDLGYLDRPAQLPLTLPKKIPQKAGGK